MVGTGLSVGVSGVALQVEIFFEGPGWDGMGVRAGGGWLGGSGGGIVERSGCCGRCGFAFNCCFVGFGLWDRGPGWDRCESREGRLRMLKVSVEGFANRWRLVWPFGIIYSFEQSCRLWAQHRPVPRNPGKMVNIFTME